MSEQQNKILKAVNDLARACNYEAGHTHQVTKLALILFDELKPLHKLGADDRFLLNCGAMLHDIGWMQGPKGHHKTARNFIMDTDLHLEPAEHKMVALIARYHRKALPKDTHKYFCELSETDRERVSILACILRIADGLDRTHTDTVKNIKAEISDKKIIFFCQSAASCASEIYSANKKSDLFCKIFDTVVSFEVISK